MLIPVCCFSCNRRVGEWWIEYTERVDCGEPAGDVLSAIGMHRQCCRRMLLTAVELNSLFVDHEIAHQEIGVEVHRSSDEERTVVLEGSSMDETE